MLLVDELVASSVQRSLANQITVLLTLEAQLLRVDVIEAEDNSRHRLTAELRGAGRGLVTVGRNASLGMPLGPPARVWFEI